METCLLSLKEYFTIIKSWEASDNEADFSCSKVGLGSGDTSSKEQFGSLLEQFHKSDDPDALENCMFGNFQ